jgi:hypothetical protein
MTRKQFCCDASRDHYAEYYIMRQQEGGERSLVLVISVVTASGHVWPRCSICVLPYSQANAKNLGIGALKTGMQMANNVLLAQIKAIRIGETSHSRKCKECGAKLQMAVRARTSRRQKARSDEERFDRASEASMRYF